LSKNEQAPCDRNTPTANPYALIITGPTASGKTLLSEMIASKLSCEIINADVGQFYQQLCIGTAKPDLKNVNYEHHLFDILDKPQDLSVVKYRKLVVDLVKDICNRGKVPVIVGGSQFYIKSLFFTPHEFSTQEFPTQELVETTQENPINLDKLDANELWQLLHTIDPVRAEKLHANDVYRVKRALDIWLKTGVKPSTYKPIFDTAFNALIICVQPELDVLKERIRLRTVQMIQPNKSGSDSSGSDMSGSAESGWIKEAQDLIGTEWEEFLKIKNLIGYTEIFDWIRSGKKLDELPALIEKIQTQTLQYAKRQKTFWKSFEREILQAASKSVKTMAVGLPNDVILTQTLEAWRSFSNR